MSEEKKKTPEEIYAEEIYAAAMDDAYKHIEEGRKKIANQIMKAALKALCRATNKTGTDDKRRG